MVFPSARLCLFLGRSWGLWVMAHLITCSPWTYHRATDHYSNFQLPSILKSIQLYCLPSFYWHQTRTWLLRHIMEFPLIDISDIIPPLYPIVLHPFILLGYPTYRDKTHTYFVRSPLRGISLSFPGVKCPHRVLPPLKCTNLSIDRISHILKNGQTLSS